MTPPSAPAIAAADTTSYTRAAGWMVGWFAAMMMMIVAGRTVLAELNPFEVMELRSLVGLVLLSPLIVGHGGLRSMATKRPLMQLGRNVAHYSGQYLWFLALSMIPIAQLVSIEFTMPIWTAVLASIFLGERVTLRKGLAIALGLVGVVVIVRPGMSAANAGQLIMLFAAVTFAISVVMVKSLTRTDSTVVIIFWMLIVQSLLGFLPALRVWSWPSAELWPWLVLLGFSGTFSHYCLTNAMRFAEATVVVPMDFLRVPLSAAVGWLVYAERLDLVTVLGAGVILVANLFNLAGRRADVAPPVTCRGGS